MKRQMQLFHEFVEFVPDTLRDGVVYISIKFGTVVHKCPCGCGSEIVTPLSPKGWELVYDGQTVSLEPSIGNWSLPCRSHYWIIRGKVVWARPRLEPQDEAGPLKDSHESRGSSGKHKKNFGKATKERK